MQLQRPNTITSAIAFVVAGAVSAGSIPPELGDLVELEYLRLNDNKLTGKGVSGLKKLSFGYPSGFLLYFLPACLTRCGDETLLRTARLDEQFRGARERTNITTFDTGEIPSRNIGRVGSYLIQPRRQGTKD